MTVNKYILFYSIHVLLKKKSSESAATSACSGTRPAESSNAIPEVADSVNYLSRRSSGATANDPRSGHQAVPAHRQPTESGPNGSNGRRMAFTFAAFCYMLALLLTAALIFFAIWHVSGNTRSVGSCGRLRRRASGADVVFVERAKKSSPPGLTSEARWP